MAQPALGLTLSDLSDVYEATFSARHKWRDILLELGVSHTTIESIAVRSRENPGNCYREVLTEWLKEGERSWRDLVKALSSPIVGHGDIAMAIERDYIRSASDTPGAHEAVTVEELMRKYSVSSEQLDCEIEEGDVIYLASHFDNVELYLSVLGLSAGEQTDVRVLVPQGTRIAMTRCLVLWRRRNPFQATLRALLKILLRLGKGQIASNICNYYCPRSKQQQQQEPSAATVKHALMAKEKKLYEEAVQRDGSVPLLYLKMLAIGPGQVGKTTFLKRLIKHNTKQNEESDHCSTGQAEMEQVYIRYSREIVAVSTKQWQAVESEKEAEEQTTMLMSLVVKHSKEKRAASLAHNSEDTIAIEETESPTNEDQSTDLNIPSDISATLEAFKSLQRECYNSRSDSQHNESDTPEADAILINVADIGGQPAFLEMLPSLTIGPAMYLVFMKLLDGLRDSCPVMYKPRGSFQAHVCKGYTYSTEEVIFTILSSIACFGHSDEDVERYLYEKAEEPASKTQSLALLLGTFADKVTDELKLKRTEENLKEQLKDTPCYKDGSLKFSHHPEYDNIILRINNKSGSEEELEKQRKFLENLIVKKFRKYAIPIKWMEFSVCLRLLAQQKRKIELSLSDCLFLGKELGMSEEMVKVALQFLHKYIGLVLYFPGNENLQNQVICDPQAVFSSISELMFKVYNPNYLDISEEVCEAFIKTGHFSITDIECCWQAGEKLLTLEYLIELMVYLNIAAPSKAKGMYFLPAILRSVETEPNTESEDLPEPLCISFGNGFLPLGFVCALIAKLINMGRFELQKEEKIYKNKVKFLLRGLYDVILISWPKYCEFRVSRADGARDDENFHNESCCPFIRETIREAVDCVVDSMSQSSVFRHTKTYTLGFKCPSSKHESTEYGHKPLAILDLNNTLKCTKCGICPKVKPSMHAWLAPRITSKPLSDITVDTGKEVTLSITATGAEHQLCKNDGKISESKSEQEGNYYCEVSNSFGGNLQSSKTSILKGSRESSKHTDFQISKGIGLSFHGDEDIWELKKIHSELQLNGEGIKIAILDTGLFHHHHSFADKIAQIRWLNFVADPLGQLPLPCDTAVTFPGNHCTAIVSLALQVAPKATIYVLRVSTSCNSGWEPGHITAALDALLGMDDQTRPDIVSMSFGFPNHDYGWEDKIDELEKRGTICVAAAGNSGAYQKEIPPPACFSKVISVGSLSIHGEISGFTPKSRNIQVYAPGEDFQAPCLPDNYDSSGIVTTIADPNSPTVLTNGNIFIEKSATSCVRGTSMATPVIAGLLALLFQHADRLTSGRCRKVRKSTFACSALTSHMQDAMGSQVLRPYEFFSKPMDFFQSYYT